MICLGNCFAALGEFAVINFISVSMNRYDFYGRVLRLWQNAHWQEYASFDSLLPRAGLGQFGKGWNIRGTTTRRRLTKLEALLPELEQVVPIYSLSVAVGPTAKH